MASSKKRGVVDLNARAHEQRAQQNYAGAPPNLGPGVTDHHAAGYVAGVQARRGAGLPKTNAPVAGGPAPPMPALEQPHQPGFTMASQAAQTRREDSARMAHQAVAYAPEDSIIAHDVQHQAPADPTHAAAPPDLMLLPQDLLPQEATKDPAYRQGTGSRMAMSQAHMAAKYGVIRNGRHIPPGDLVRGQQMPGQPGGQAQRKRRPPEEVKRDFERALGAPPQDQTRRNDDEPSVRPPAGLPRTDEEAIAQAKAGPGGAAERAGQAPVVPVLDDKAMKEHLEQMDDMDFETLRREMIKDILKNPKQKEIVEARCKELDINELIMQNVVTQRVPIIPGKFEPTFESMRGDVELVMKRLLVQESKSVSVTENYLLDKYAVMTTTSGVIAINGNPIPSMYDANGDFNEDMFWKKFNWMLKRPIHMLASLGIHYSWFEQRVRKLFKVDEGKDG